MSSKNLTMLAVAVILGVIGFALYFIPAAGGGAPNRVLMKNKGGNVVFRHADHADGVRYGSIKCIICHHKSSEGVKPENMAGCGLCHPADFDNAFRFGHSADYRKRGMDCTTCHPAKFDAGTGFVGGEESKLHAKHGDLDCTDCHHDDDIETDGPGESGGCSACHKSGGDAEDVPVMKAAHTKCANCHDEWMKGAHENCTKCHSTVKMTDSTRFNSCASCHKNKKTSELLPARMGAMHKQCMGCHRERKRGPYKNADDLKKSGDESAEPDCGKCHRK